MGARSKAGEVIGNESLELWAFFYFIIPAAVRIHLGHGSRVPVSWCTTAVCPRQRPLAILTGIDKASISLVCSLQSNHLTRHMQLRRVPA